MRGVVVAVAMLAAVQSAEAKTWTCQLLGHSPCEGGKCGTLGAPHVTSNVREDRMREDMQLGESDYLYFTRANKQTAVYAVTYANKGFEYGYCWPLKPRP